MARMKSGPSLEDRFKGCLLGLAIGDAMGYPTEFLTLPEIHKRYGFEGIRHLQGNPALYSDDTQMSISVARSLIKAGHHDIESLMAILSKEFLEWFRSAENDRSPGNTSIKGCQRLEEGIPWKESGIPESKGCGANMRVAPIGLYYHQDPQNLRLLARSSALITHGHPSALVAAEATAFCIAWAISGVAPSEYLDRIMEIRQDSLEAWNTALGEGWKRSGYCSRREYLEAGWTDLLGALDKVPTALSKDSLDVCEHVGGAWVAEETLACALVCVVKHPEDYCSAIIRGANSSGDSDSIACIAGAISGGYCSVNAIPKDWTKRIENRQLLIDLSKQLYQESMIPNG